MPTISSAGIGSGLDISSIVDGLMAVEQRPLQLLQTRQQLYTTQISAYGELISAVSSFQSSMQSLNSLDALDKFRTSSTNTDIVEITSTDSPDYGSYTVEVTRLADYHKMTSVEILSTDVIGGNADDAVSIQVGSNVADTMTVDLSAGMTLSEIRDAINTDDNNPGVRATIVNGDNDLQRLVFTSTEMGSANALSLSYGGTLITNSPLGMATLNDINNDTANLDAEFIVDGFTITRASNTISDVISGVTFELNSAKPNTAETLSISRDTGGTESLVKSFATAYNKLVSSIDGQRSGTLGTDNLLLSIENQVKHILNSVATSGNLSTLSDVGLGIDKEGVMSFDAVIFQQTVSDTSYADVAKLFAAEGDGFANRLVTLADNWIGNDGLISSRTDGLNKRIDQLTDKQASIERNLTLIEARYRAQFSALDILVSQFQSTGEYLTSQLAQLPSLTLNKK